MCLAFTVKRSEMFLSDDEAIKSSKMTSIGCPETLDLILLKTLSLSSIKLTPNDRSSSFFGCQTLYTYTTLVGGSSAKPCIYSNNFATNTVFL